MKLIIVFSCLFFLSVTSTFVLAQENSSANLLNQENRISYSDVVTEIPETSWSVLKTSFSKDSIPWWTGIIGSTLVLIHNDEVILNDFQTKGREWGLGNRDNTKAFLSAGEIDIIRLPTDLGSMMYFLGDGWMHFGIAGGFYWYGLSNNDNRAFNTALRIAHGMTTSTIFNQLLKRSFGRESPYVKSEPFGKWSPFPSIPEYQRRTSRYDAMPSGHIMTATLVFTVINESYPEYSHWVIPTEILWLTLLGYQMVNNGVHWASDYPLGIAMGYVIGKQSAMLGKKDLKNTNSQNDWKLSPVAFGNYWGIDWSKNF